ncbi:MAG TPA: sulfotransferase domain-containing protein [Candidatus Elarobacter sp.]|nr:sulfotransferase domain-containing protein [Candidatus Elarobacter sp.]
MPDAIFIVGMHRSGTSALTRVFSLCGGALPARLLPPDAGNPSGYWEPLGAIEVDDAHLRARGSSWYDTRTAREAEPPDAAHVEGIVDFLSTAYTAPGPLLVKEPRITLLLPAWLAAADTLEMPVRIVHVVRDPFDVAASLAVRNHVGADHALALWLKYNLAGARDARGRRRLFVAYDDVLENWRAVVERCAEELDVSLAIGPETPRAVEEHLNPALRHHHGTRPRDAGAADPELVAWAREAYGALRRAAARGGEPQLDGAAAGFAASSYAAGRAWPEPLAESAGYAASATPSHRVRANGTAPFGLGEGVLDAHAAELNRLRYQLEKERYEREIAEREAASEVSKARAELASALASAERVMMLHEELETRHAELRARVATTEAARDALQQTVAALTARTHAVAQQLYEALQQRHALAAELAQPPAGEPGSGSHADALARVAALEATVARLERTAEQLRAQLAARDAALAALQSSRSWRLTAPLRRAKRALAP